VSFLLPFVCTSCTIFILIIRISIGDLIAGVGWQQRRLPRAANTLAPQLISKPVEPVKSQKSQNDVTFGEANIITANITINFHFTGATLINIMNIMNKQLSQNTHNDGFVAARIQFAQMEQSRRIPRIWVCSTIS